MERIHVSIPEMVRLIGNMKFFLRFKKMKFNSLDSSIENSSAMSYSYSVVIFQFFRRFD